MAFQLFLPCEHLQCFPHVEAQICDMTPTTHSKKTPLSVAAAAAVCLLAEFATQKKMFSDCLTLNTSLSLHMLEGMKRKVVTASVDMHL